MAMRRRDFMKIIGGAAANWPFAARAQPREQMRRIGLLWSLLSADESQTLSSAFVQGLQELGWSVGRNLRIDHRWGLSDPDRLRRSAEELVALAPDALFAAGNSAATELQQATRTLPIVFANVPDPVGAGFVDSLPRPGGNMTGFMNMYPTRNFVIGGGLICHGADVPDLYRRSASYVDRILKGEKPADLPVQTPTKYEVVLNLKTAKALGLDVPPTLLARADEVIE
jgi:ABC-type uncharacterized transport system substrate-binding protein